ncbi:MAG TPA: hypothetical protein VN859_01805 [Steroidobacteraceae bacterium]|nr:hypothetical protein [Steroidobacteraceae bacterium]
MLLLCLTVATALPGCSLFHRHRSTVGCREPKFAPNTVSLPPLRVPPGMSAADTHNAVRIPALDVPEPSRPPSAPCLSMPPSFAVPETHGPPVRSSVPLPPVPGAAPNGPE